MGARHCCGRQPVLYAGMQCGAGAVSGGEDLGCRRHRASGGAARRRAAVCGSLRCGRVVLQAGGRPAHRRGRGGYGLRRSFHAGFPDILDVLADAGSQHITGLQLQADGKVVLSVVTGVFPACSGFAAVRLLRDGAPDAWFAGDGVARYDIAAGGADADAVGLTLHAGRPLLASHARRDADGNLTGTGAGAPGG